VQWRWARAHREVDITGEGGALATRKRSEYWRPAVCGEVLLAEGEAYAEFTVVSGGYLMVGVARAAVDPELGGGRALRNRERLDVQLQLRKTLGPYSYEYHS